MPARSDRSGTPLVFLTLIIATSIAGASKSFAQAQPTFTVLADVDQPFGGVIKASDGALYGTSRIGPGASTCGYVYRLDPQSDGTFTLTVLHAFAGGLDDGCQPQGELVEGADGAFYGTTRVGGPNRDTGAAVEGTGSIYKMMPNGQYAFVRFFAGATSGFYQEGLGPITGLTLGPDGNFYGTTSAGGLGGGIPGPGTIFNVTPDGALTVLDDFSPEKGLAPQDGLTASDGHLYGTSIASGPSNPAGALFRIAPGGGISRVFTFPWDGCADPQCYPQGANPWAAPTEVSGQFYVLGHDYGLGGGGTIVRADPDGTGTLLHDFSGSNGSAPHRGLAPGADGALYGLTRGGGSQDMGTIFRLTSTGTVETLHDFSAPLGAVPEGRLLEIAPGEFIGTTSSGNPTGGGLVFRFSVNSGNEPPEASDSAAETFEDITFSGLLSATDPDSDPLSFEVVVNGSKGTAAITDPATGAFSYTPNADVSGTDTFTFKANDGTADSNIATITVTITAVNDAPVAADGSLSTNQGTLATGTLSASDIDGPALAFTIVQNGTKGTATITDASTGAFRYLPNAGATGADTFTFIASDGSLASNIATVAVNIVPIMVTVISPNGGERVFVSNPTTISWSATGAAQFDVVLSRNGVTGTYVFPIPECTALPGSATSCLWTPVAPGSSSASIKVIARSGTAMAVDTSDSTFLLSTATPTITVTTPNTSLTWAETSSRTIQWGHNLGAGSQVRLELSRNGGATWEVLAASVQNTTANLGSFVWMVTGPTTTAALVRVSWLAGSASDVSNTTFTIAAPTLTVTSPNTAVTWAAGTSRTLGTSHNLGAGQSIAFDVSRDGGSTWTPVGVATSSATTANLSWTVTGPPTTQARIRATWISNPGTSDVNDANFTISPRVTVTMPNTAVVWTAGTLRTVTWTHTLGLGQLVNIDVSTNNGATWSSVATNVPNTTATSGAATVRMPDTVTTQALVRVSPVSFPVADGDVSNVPFKLVAPLVTVTLPNSNVLWAIGTTPTIMWTHNLGTAESVNLDVSRDGGTTWTAIATDVLNATNGKGSFVWTVTGPASMEARIRVRWTVNGSVQDMSNVNFTIQ
jgi:uncharacterized repeat protein (TIGR03803 family)/VCBS repeat-containing protein